MTDPKRQGGEQELLAQMDQIVHALGIEDSHVTPVERIAELFDTIEALQQRVGELKAQWESVFTGGNHLGLLIGANHPPHTASCDEALTHYGAGTTYEIWCCWKAIMDAYQALREEPGEGGGNDPDRPHSYSPCEDADVCFDCGLPREDPIHGTGSRKGGQHD